MLFRKSIEKSCAYCTRSGQSGNGSLLCSKKGFVTPNDQCRHFQYDPLKRTPTRRNTKDFSQFSEADFSL